MSVRKPRVRPSKARKVFINLNSFEARVLLTHLEGARMGSESNDFMAMASSVIEQLEAQNVSGGHSARTEPRT